jgi:ABC-type sugar transport system permease subunit
MGRLAVDTGVSSWSVQAMMTLPLMMLALAFCLIVRVVSDVEG